MQYIMQILLI